MKYPTAAQLKPMIGAAVAPLQYIGAVNSLRSLISASWSSLKSREPIGRHFLLQSWQGLGSREAIIMDGERVSFEQLYLRVLRLTQVFQGLGIKPGDSVAVLLHNEVAWFEIMAATMVMGIKMPMINWHLNASETAQCLILSNASVLILGDAFVEKIESVSSQLEHIHHKLVVSNSPVKSGNFQDYNRLVENAIATLANGGFSFSPKPFSGGTTGLPKFINLETSVTAKPNRRQPPLADFLQLALKQAATINYFGLEKINDPYTRNIRSVIPGPLYHTGVLVGVIPLFFGGSVVPMKKFDPEEFLAIIERERINWCFVAPTMLERIINLPSSIQHKYDLSSMRTLLCSAAPCPVHVKKATNALFRAQGNPYDVFHEFYGGSEIGCISILAPSDYADNEKLYASVGKVRSAQCKIYNKETGTWAKTGETGNVLVRSPQVFRLSFSGYTDAEMETCFVEVDGQFWYDDGLFGYLDSDNFLYLTSREKEMIISGGVNIYPNEIESILKQHPAVQDATVVRAPHKDLGEIPAAVLKLKGTDQPTNAALLAFCKEKGLYGFKLPKHFEWVDEFPRDAAGKVRKKQIENALWEGIESVG